MLNFRNTNIALVALLVIIITVNLLYSVPLYAYIILVITYSLTLFYGSYFVSSNFYIRVICSATTDKKEIAISFDDGPAQHFTPEILEVLKENKVQAAFFCIGKNIPGNELLFRRIHEEGHVIGNHSYSHHFWFDLFSSKKMLTDMRSMDEAMKRVTGLTPRLFRPPYGVTNPNLKKAVTEGNYIPIGWSVRSLDTVTTDAGSLLKKINNSLSPGAIILFHDTSDATLAMLPEFIQKVKSKGYAIVRLDKLLTLNAYA